MKVRIFYRSVYGNMLAYPADETALNFAAQQLQGIRRLGFEIMAVPDPKTVVPA